MRISKTQADAMFLLVALEMRGKVMPFPSARLMDLINTQRCNQIARQNFQAGMKTLASNGLIRIFRAQNLSMAYLLTDEGRALGESIYSDRTQDEEKRDA